MLGKHKATYLKPGSRQLPAMIVIPARLSLREYGEMPFQDKCRLRQLVTTVSTLQGMKEHRAPWRRSDGLVHRTQE